MVQKLDIFGIVASAVTTFAYTRTDFLTNSQETELVPAVAAFQRKGKRRLGQT